jgi:hypothetical protein
MTPQRAALALALLAGTALLAGCGGSEPITATMEKPPAAVAHPAEPAQ